MNNSLFNLGIIRETRTDETRAPLTPKHIKELKKKLIILRLLYNHPQNVALKMKNIKMLVR